MLWVCFIVFVEEAFLVLSPSEDGVALIFYHPHLYAVYLEMSELFWICALFFQNTQNILKDSRDCYGCLLTR